MATSKIYLTESEAAALIGVAVDTMRVWRNKSRRAGRLIGPRWIEVGGTGRARMIRYREIDLIGWLESGLITLEPPKRRGRPKRVEAA